MRANPSNEKTKRRYFRWLKEAEGCTESTIRSVERAICVFEDYTESADFKIFCERQATGFKRWLNEKRRSGKPLSTATVYQTIRHLKVYFKWLAGQPGYKSQISLDAVSYLSLDKKTVRAALAPRPRKFPDLDYVIGLTGSIDVQNDIDQRDRALVAFLLLAGMRYTAICTLTLACVELDSLTVHQDPRLGVKTKFGESITTRLFGFSDTLTEYVVSWVEYLSETKGFQPTDPLFPKTKTGQVEGGYTFVASGVEPVQWSGGNAIREILRRRSLAAGLPYFAPHAFRRAAIQLAGRHCITPEQYKAVSQNLGHKDVATTLLTYGMLDSHKVGEVLGEIDFANKPGFKGEGIPPGEVAQFLKKYQSKA
ncbi:MAG: tyrosine-type recombinase/integrase [candidate division Zixibacteria bacterium]|nr:tyrosine-type recombinase/integrase [candidate division Zixibacteria bacterium]